jgi:hypothetical protein
MADDHDAFVVVTAGDVLIHGYHGGGAMAQRLLGRVDQQQQYFA